MPDASTFSTRYVATCATMLQHATRQRRTARRALLLTMGLVLVSGRSMVSRMLIVLGLAMRDWTAVYRLFATPRIDLDRLWRQVVVGWLALSAPTDPLVVVVDGTQLPRTGRKIPGVGFGRAPRTPAWRPGIHLTQRWEGISGLTPPTVDGDCRAIPLQFLPAPTPASRRWEHHPPMPEWQAAIAGVQHLRATLAAVGTPDRALMVVGDGAYSGAGIWTSLPAHTTWIARCAKNRALYHLPEAGEAPRRGRRRCYGTRGPTPQQQGQMRAGWQRCVVRVRGKDRHLRVRITGPWLMKKAADQPLMLMTIGGLGRGPRTARRSRDMMHFLVNARRTPDGWALPYALADLVMWVWQRWEVEVMHRELKSGWGLGDQQQWSPVAAATVIQWMVWAYAVLMLTGVTGPPPRRRATRWYRARRWTPRDLTLQLRDELWTTPPRQFGGHAWWFRGKQEENASMKDLLAVVDAL